MVPTQDAKSKDLERNAKEYGDPKNKITTDWGVKVSTTDDWLKATSDDKQGPMLLEDPIAREKVPVTVVFDHGII
jgi:catalase